MMISRVQRFAAVMAAALLAPGMAAQSPTRTVTIVGAEVADGTGAALRRANVRFAGNRIVSVGAGAPEQGDTIVDAAGLVLAPGFIDIHNHSAEGLPNDPAAAS